MFKKRKTIKQVEEGNELAPKFDQNGFIPVVTTDAKSGVVLMHAYMNDEALKKTISTKEAHYYSRSRKCLWHKGATSGLVQDVKNIDLMKKALDIKPLTEEIKEKFRERLMKLGDFSSL